jgi:hypothetical protein
MKKFIAFCLIITTIGLSAQTKSKLLKLKYTAPEGWNVVEFGGPTSWDESGNVLCKCSGLQFTKQNKNGKLNVVVYPSTVSGLDSSKRDMVGSMKFMDVEKYDKTKNKFFSFERKRSTFHDLRDNKKMYEVIKYKTKIDDHFYVIYAWQENMGMMSPDTEKELYQVVNALEPL